jgi:hypothetical protein
MQRALHQLKPALDRFETARMRSIESKRALTDEFIESSREFMVELRWM